MPTYDYRCDHCGHTFSAIQSFNDGWLTACPNCGAEPRRLMSMPAIVFKGPGWYKTDSRASESDTSGAPISNKDGKEPAKAATATAEGGSAAPAAAESKSEKAEKRSEKQT